MAIVENAETDGMRHRLAALFIVACMALASAAEGLPAGFVYLSQAAPTVHQDIRYFGPHNFIGRPVAYPVVPGMPRMW